MDVSSIYSHNSPLTAFTSSAGQVWLGKSPPRPSYLLVNLFGSLLLSDVYIPSMLDPGHYGKLYTILNNPRGTAMIRYKNLRFLIVSNIETDIQVI